MYTYPFEEDCPDERRISDVKKNNKLNKIKNFLGLYSNPLYIEEHLTEANLKSLRYISVISLTIETAMLARFFIKYVFTGQITQIGDILSKTYGYWTLLITSFLLFIYAGAYLGGRLVKLKRFRRLFSFIYYAFGIYFGVVTTIHDLEEGRMMTCYLTMLLLVSMVFIWRPFISIILTVVCGGGFIFLVRTFSQMEDGSRYSFMQGDVINFATYLITLLIVEISMYSQRYQEASKSYRLECSAITDVLTGLPNMRRFDKEAREHAAESLSEGKQPIYLLFDIQSFQTYNDRFGYSGGDELLGKMGRLIAEEFEGEPFARISADKFAALTDRDDIEKCVQVIGNRLKAVAQTESYLNVKVGSYKVKKADTEPRRALDRAAYALKQIKGKDGVLINEYSNEMSKELKQKKFILNNIDNAVKDGHIKTYYQPVICAEDETLIGCEALARWIDPQLGMISPGQFVPILEESRQIHKLDRCILENVCRNMRECLDSGKPVLPVSLNFSRLDFDIIDVVGELEATTGKYSIPKGCIHAEITESALSNDVEKMKNAVSRLHSCGYEVWLDDFGSEYSSLNVLKDFSFDLLKIDMGFLKNFSGNNAARKLIQGIIAIANSLEMKTLSEGVETLEAVEFLKEAGCGHLQGYYYSKPVPYDELLEKIADCTFRLNHSVTEINNK